MNKLNYLFVLYFLFSVSGVSGQEFLSLEDCRQLALENNKQVGTSGMMYEQSVYELNSYKAKFLPRFSATGMYFLSTGEMKKTIDDMYLPVVADANPVLNQFAYIPAFSLNLKTNGSYMGGLQVEQPLYTGGKIRTAYQMAQVGKEMAGINRKLTHTEVIRQTDEAYWTAVQVRELLVSANTYKQVVQELMRNVENAFEAGMVSKNDLLKVQVKLNDAELQIARARNGIRLADMNLCHVTGLPLTSVVELRETLDGMLLAVDSSADVTQRPEYLLMEKQVEWSNQQIKLVRSDYLPQVGVMANYGYMNALKLNDQSLIDNASFSALFSVNIPLFQWGEGKNKVRAAKTQKKIRELQLEENVEKMELQLMQAVLQYEEALLEVQLTTSAFMQAEENMHVSGSFYEAGLETLADYLEAQTIWQKAWAEQVQAKTRLRMSETNYLIAAGKIAD